MNIVIRPPTETDIPFIFSTWLKGLYHGNLYYKKIKQDVFYAKYHKVLESILPRYTVRVACMEDEPDVILGYVVYLGDVLHWAFVKKAWRKLGIANKLLADVTINKVSHLTKVGESIAKRKNLEFDPFLF